MGKGTPTPHGHSTRYTARRLDGWTAGRLDGGFACPYAAMPHTIHGPPPRARHRGRGGGTPSRDTSGPLVARSGFWDETKRGVGTGSVQYPASGFERARKPLALVPPAFICAKMNKNT